MTTLLVSPLESDHAALKGMFTQTKWQLRSAYRCREALEMLQSESIPVVITLELLPDGNWLDLLDGVSRMPAPGRLLVSSREPHERLWGQVLQAGAYDIVPRPWIRSEVLKLNALAWQSWAFAWRSGKSRPMAGEVDASGPEDRVLIATSAG